MAETNEAKLFEDKMNDLISLQEVFDRRTGTCGIEEAGWSSYHPTDGCEEWMSDEAQREIIAICSIVNELHERARKLESAEMERAVKEAPARKGITTEDLYMVGLDTEEGIVITKERADEMVWLYAQKGTKVSFSVVDQEWTIDETGGTVDSEYVEEIK